MPAWATVVLTIVGGLIGVAGTLSATVLQNRYGRRERREREQRELVERLAVTAGKVRALLSDADPTRVGVNVNELSPGMITDLERRWQPLRDELFALSVVVGSSEASKAADLLATATSNLLNRDRLLVNDLLGRGAPTRDWLSDARHEHTQATVALRQLLHHAKREPRGNSGATDTAESDRNAS